MKSVIIGQPTTLIVTGQGEFPWAPTKEEHSLAHLQLFYRLAPFAYDQAHFRGWDEDLLDRAVAIKVVVEARPVPTAVHNLPQ